MKYYSTKRFGPICTGRRQWRDDGHCKFIHGYGRHVQITFTGELDHRQWVMDFGYLREIKQWLEEQWDHRTLIASDDPNLEDIKQLHQLGVININIMDVEKGYGPGIEASCKFVYDYVNDWAMKQSRNRVKVSKVEIWEHENNSAIYESND